MDATFDEMYVLSDLHIGGRKPVHPSDPDLRIFDMHELLRDTLKLLAGKAGKAKRVGVVLNGDVFDFLAQAGVQPAGDGRYFFPEEAARWLDVIAADFPEVFEGMRAVVAARGATLVIVVGNHDIELAMPPVQARLRALLGADEAAGRLVFHTDGAGFRASIGAASVLCTHGERSDTWNAVDHNRLTKVARALRDGRQVGAWKPTPGHGMVMDVLNPVKVKYPFVDLFQPQDDRVILLYRWVDPELDAYRRHILANAVEAGKRDLALLSVEEGEADPSAVGGADAPALELLNVDEGVDPMDLVGDGELLGISDTLRQLKYLFTPSAWSEQLRTWLLKWADDQSDFDPGKRDICAKWAETEFGADVRYVVCGHTHLRKHIRWPGGRAYFNSGSWIPLMRVPRSELQEPEKLLATLRSRDRAALERLVERVPTVVRFLADGTAGLCDVKAVGAGVELVPLEVRS